MSKKMLPWLFVWTLFLLMSATQVLAKAAQPAGQVIAAGAGVKAKATNGVVRPLKRRSKVYQGDTIITGRSSAQIRFSDGALTALRPGTKFKIVTFRWPGKQDGSEKGIFSLIKGGLSAISGAIGKKHRNNYQMRTPVATIGIRGTSYFLEYLNGILKGGVTEGRIYVWNGKGNALLRTGQHFYVKSGKIIILKGKIKGVKPKPVFGEGGIVPSQSTGLEIPPSYSTDGGNRGGGGTTFGGGSLTH